MKPGFGSSPRRRKVYLNPQYEECLWYFWDHPNSRHIPIFHESLTGQLKSIYFTEKEYKKNPNQKINFVMDCGDDRFILEVGIDTIPARKLVEGFSIVDIGQAITLEPQRGDKEPNAIFVNFYAGNDRIRVDACKDSEFLGLLEILMTRINGTNPDEPAPAPVSSAQSAPLPKLGTPQLTPTQPKLPVLPPPSNAPKTISDVQRKLFAKLAKDAAWEVVAIKAYLGSCGYTHSSTIAPKDFESICAGLGELDIKDHFHRAIEITADQALPLGTWEAA